VFLSWYVIRRKYACDPTCLQAEDDRNEAKLITPIDMGGFGIDCAWADDIHHELRVMVAGYSN